MVASAKGFFSWLFLSIGFWSCAQTKNAVVVKAQAFYKVQHAGNIPVNDEGVSLYRGPDTLYIVYVETNTTGVEWTAAWAGKKNYTMIATTVTTTPHVAGSSRKTGEKITLTKTGKNTLQQLEFVPYDEFKVQPKKIQNGQILLEGKKGKQIIYHTIPQAIVLSTPEAQ